jgi:MFS family permease
MAFIDAFGTGAFLAISAIYLTRTVLLPEATVGLGLSVSAAVGLVTAVPFGILADRYGVRRILVAVTLWRAAWMAAFLAVDRTGTYLLVVVAIGLVDKIAAPLEQALVGAVADERTRVSTMAIVRSLRNAGFGVGAMAGALALAADQRAVYAAVIVVNALSFVLTAVLAATMRLPATGARVRTRLMRSSLLVLRDQSYISLAAVNALLTMHMSLLSIGIPLWVVGHTDAPRLIPAVLFTVNTVLAVMLQVRASRGADTVDGSARLLRRAGPLLALTCLLLAGAGWLRAWPAVAVLVAAVLALTAAELYQSAGAWGLSYALAPAEERAAYLSVFGLGIGVQQMVAPTLLVMVVIGAGPVGWVGLAVVLALIGLAVPRLVAWTVARRPVAVESRALTAR